MAYLNYPETKKLYHKCFNDFEHMIQEQKSQMTRLQELEMVVKQQESQLRVLTRRIDGVEREALTAKKRSNEFEQQQRAQSKQIQILEQLLDDQAERKVKRSRSE